MEQAKVLGPIWIGASDTEGDNVIRYLGEGGAIIPDGSTVWAEGQPDHGSDLDSPGGVEMDVSGLFALKACNEGLNFGCEPYQ